MNCQDVQGQLSDYLDFSLSAARLALVEEHLAACPPCREEAELLDESIREVAALPALDTPLGFTQRVMSHVREEETRPSFWQRFVWPLSGKLPAQATAVVIVGFLGIYLLQKEQPQGQLIPMPETVTTAGNASQDSASFTANETGAPKTSVVPRPQSSPAQKTPQVAPSRREPQSNSQEEITSQVEAPAAQAPSQLPLTDSARTPPDSEPAETDVTLRATPVVSGTPAVTAPTSASSSTTPFSNLSDPDSSAFRANPLTIEPFADLELVVRRHTTRSITDGTAVRKTDVMQTAPRPIERLMAVIPDRSRPQTIWINVPENQYEEFKNELYMLGIIESESRVPMLREPGHADGQIRVKLTALPAAETTSPNNTPTGR